MRRLILAMPILLVSAVAAGCQATSSTFSCSNADCEVSLSGSGSDAELYSDSVLVQLVSVSDGSATISVDTPDTSAEEISCAAGETVDTEPITLTCDEVTDDGVTFTTELR